METMLIKAVIFDFGNVIASFDHMLTCKKLGDFSSLKPDKIYKIIFRNGLEKRFDEGKLTSSEFYARTKKEIGGTDGLSFAEFSIAWKNIFTENSAIENVFARIKPDVEKYLLSNTNTLHWEHISHMPIVRKYFSDPNHLTLSFAVRARKPAKEIYTDAIGKAGVEPKEVLYIDDIPEYVETFRSLGGKGIVYNCQTDPIDTLISSLLEHGILK